MPLLQFQYLDHQVGIFTSILITYPNVSASYIVLNATPFGNRWTQDVCYQWAAVCVDAIATKFGITDDPVQIAIDHGLTLGITAAWANQYVNNGATLQTFKTLIS